MENQKIVSQFLIQEGLKLLNNSFKPIEYTNNPEANNLLNNLQKYPHAFVLACLMDRRIRAERAWIIPYKIYNEIGSFTFSSLLTLSKEKVLQIFKLRKLHFMNNRMGKLFYQAIQRIHINYNGDASKIWMGNPSSAKVIIRFLEFNGIGPKIATMATNILVRDYKIKLRDYACINISPDVQVKRVFKRLGFISKNATDFELMLCGRNLNLEYPGVFDWPCWQIGRNWCRPNNPLCNKCYLEQYCPKVI